MTRSSRETRRAQSLPPAESPRKGSGSTRREDLTEALNNSTEEETSALRPLPRRGRSTSPGVRRRDNAYQARSAVLRQRSLATSSLTSTQATGTSENPNSTSSPFNSSQPHCNAGSQHEEKPDEARQALDSVPKTAIQAACHVTPKTSRFFFSSSPLSSPPSVFPQTPTFHRESDCFAQSSLGRPALAFSSSPLSSPPPVLFDPFEERSSSTSRQASSVASSAADSDTDESPPSSQPNKSTLPNIKGRDLFDASIWSDPLRTSVFYTFATTLRQKVKDVEPTESHHFIGHLRNRGKLVRCYTQNIDQIEEKVGLSTSLQEGPGHRGRFSRKSIGATLVPTPPENPSSSGESALTGQESGEEKRTLSDPERACGAEGVELATPPSSAEALTQRTERRSNGVECVFLHGSLESLRCFLCGKVCAWEEDGRAYETLSGRQPECPYCAGATAARQERGKRALGVGKLRPDIVLYGEEHPNAHLISPIVTHDLGLSPDLLLILGTSLKVHGLKVLVREFAKTIHSRGGKVVFVNFTKPPESSWGDIIDYWVQWDCDAWVSNLKTRIPLLWLPPGTKLPKKKKETGEKLKKRQNTADEKPKPKPETAKPCDSPEEVSPPNATVGPDEYSKATEPETLERTAPPQLEVTLATTDKAVKIEPACKETARPRPAAAKPTPQRPMAVRDDKTNAAWATWKVVTELRRIVSHDQVPPSPSPAAFRVEKLKTKRARKSAPAALPQPSHDTSPFQLRPASPHVKEELREPEPAQDGKAGTADVVMSGTEENSILAAVKLNPRRRKRKTIDGVEVCLPGLPRLNAAANALPQPTPQNVKTRQPKNRPVLVSPVSPKILSDIRRAPMDSLKLPPLQTNEAPIAVPSKPEPLEPVHSPTGPLSTMSPNVQTGIDLRIANPFYLSDPLLYRLANAPDWTPLRNLGFMRPRGRKQFEQEADAVMALQGLKKG